MRALFFSLNSRYLLAVIAMALLAGCTKNEAYRTICEDCDKLESSSVDSSDFEPCIVKEAEDPESSKCAGHYITRYEVPERDGVEATSFDLAFVEFSERGNPFDSRRIEDVLRYIEEQTEIAEKQGGGTAIVTFVHGWQHNAAVGNSNIASFRGMLRAAAKLEQAGRTYPGHFPRKIIGIYIGWRGSVFSLDALKAIDIVSYYDRKEVAHQVSSVGFSEFISRLNKTSVDQDCVSNNTIRYDVTSTDCNPNQNLLTVVGHSMGGLILLDSTAELLTDRIVHGTQTEDGLVTEPFAHSLVMLNPAIEARHLLGLKRIMSRTQFAGEQDRFLHVLTSENDLATQTTFKFAQTLSSFFWSHADVKAELADGKVVTIPERDFETVSVGQFDPFLTGYFFNTDIDGSHLLKNPIPLRPEVKENCRHITGEKGWVYINFVDETNEACISQLKSKSVEHFPVKSHEPIAVIRTDKNFISDHNDIFNINVGAYILAILSEARFKRALAAQDPALGKEGPAACRMKGELGEANFDFGKCFTKLYSGLESQWCEVREHHEAPRDAYCSEKTRQEEQT